MSWGEAIRLATQLASDPSSHVSAAMGGLEYPVERVDVTLRNLYDLVARLANKRSKPYPRPKAVTRQSQADAERIRRRLRARGHGDLLKRVERAEGAGRG